MTTKNQKGFLKAVLAMAVAVGVLVFTPERAEAAGKFDPAFYAATYPDVAAAVGMDAEALYVHYVSYGRLEGRVPYAGAQGGELVDGMEGTGIAAAALPGVVPLQNLPHYNDLKDSMTDAEFAELYNNMAPWMQLAQGLSKEEQILFVSQTVTNALVDGDVVYTNATPHCSNAYGFFYYGGADASGCARTVGLMYEMLGIQWDHAVASYNKMIVHHWSVVTLDGKRYIVDPCYGILAPEETKFEHPALDYIFGLLGIR